MHPPLIAFCGVALLLAGCNGPGNVAPVAKPTGTYDFVFHALVIDPYDTSAAAGFNLDGLYSTGSENSGCNVADRVSDLDLDQNENSCNPSGGSCQGGVDNALPGLARLLDDRELDRARTTRGDLTASVNGGKTLYLLRLTNVSSLSNATGVGVAIYKGYSTDASCSSLFGGAGHFIADSGWVSSSNLGQPLVSATGAISGGRLSVTFGANPSLPQFASGLFTTLILRVTLDGSGESGTAGNLGGRFDGPLLQALLSAQSPYRATVFREMLPYLSDLPPTTGNCGTTASYPLIALGLGLRFSLVQADITGTGTGPSPNTCGYP